MQDSRPHSHQFAPKQKGDAGSASPSQYPSNPSYGFGCAVRCGAGAGAGAGWLAGADWVEPDDEDDDDEPDEELDVRSLVPRFCVDPG